MVSIRRMAECRRSRRARTRPIGNCSTSEFRAMAIPCRSASATYAMPSGAIFGWFTSSKTTAVYGPHERPVLGFRGRRFEEQAGRAESHVADRPRCPGVKHGRDFSRTRFLRRQESQLVPILKAAIAHRGFALIDVISPCVTFNDHAGSTKSYLYTRQNQIRVTESDFVPPASPVLAQISNTGETSVTLHDGSVVRFTTVPHSYDPTDRRAVIE